MALRMEIITSHFHWPVHYKFSLDLPEKRILNNNNESLKVLILFSCKHSF